MQVAGNPLARHLCSGTSKHARVVQAACLVRKEPLLGVQVLVHV